MLQPLRKVQSAKMSNQFINSLNALKLDKSTCYEDVILRFERASPQDCKLREEQTAMTNFSECCSKEDCQV
jgi:hypothetical protein